jgi:hypothetical protein
VTGPLRSSRGAVQWLTAQAVVFGAMAALLGIVANAMFLNAYGSAWLPMTYIAIGAAGILVSGAVAKAAQRYDLLAIALVVLGGAAIGIGASWILATGGNAAWVSVPLLVLFPILIQLGFVFIGGQGGRLLDIAGIKASFPRIMAGFPVGAVLGGLLGGQLVTWLGRAEDLLLATALAQAAFAALVLATGRRYALLLGSPAHEPLPSGRASADEDQTGRFSFRRALTNRFVGLILAYQVLSALGSQFSDFLVYDRASAQYADPVDLAAFLAYYTAVMNIAAIAFLVLMAGPLLRRFGLRLGIPANPLVLTAFAIAMVVVNALSGGASFVLLATVSAARIADIALTDGMTRTSINATYQVLPERGRLSVQAAVEGMGVPIAIGISGVLILVLNALPFALAATILITTIVCAVWTSAGIFLYRAYGTALVDALRRRPLLVPMADLDATSEDEAVARLLLSSQDPRATRLGRDLLGIMSSPALAAELSGLAGDPRPDVRMSALAGLAAAGDEAARRRLAGEVRAGAGSTDAAIRLRAAVALEVLDPGDRAAAASLLEDEDVAVRCAALDSVQAGDLFAVTPTIEALGDAGSVGAAAGAIGRLGDGMAPAMAEVLDGAGSPAPLLAIRLVRAAATRSARRDEVLLRHVGHRDRDLGLVIMERLGAPEPVPDAIAVVLDSVLRDDVRHAARILGALAAIDAAGDDQREADEPVQRALRDELDLACLRVKTGRLARHGFTRLGPPMIEIGAGRSSGSLALEALEVLLSPIEAKQVLPLLKADLAVAERLDRLPPLASDAPTDLVGWLKDLVEDVDGHWRSTWLRACAVHAAKARRVLDQIDLHAARALGDPIIDELLDSASIRGSSAPRTRPRPNESGES